MKKKHSTSRKLTLAQFAAQQVIPSAHGDGSRRLVGEALRERIAEVFGHVEVDPDELAGMRLAVLWRLARAIGAAQNQLAPDTPLGAIPEEAWTTWTPSHVQGHPGGSPPWLAQVADAEVPILPHGPLEADDPAGLDTYQDVLLLVAPWLGLWNDRTNRLGLRALLGDVADRRAWPEDASQLIAMEANLIEHVFRIATVTPDPSAEDCEVASEWKALRICREDYGLTAPEAESLQAMMRAKAVSMLHESQDAFRAAQLMQLEDIARRASQGMDIKSEIAARKLIASVSGVTRSEPDDAMRDFLAVVRSVSEKRERIGEARRPALPSAREAEPLDPGPDEDEDDREAMEAYDREN